MFAYIYNAAIFCEECGGEIKTELQNDGVTCNGDSDAFPQGPYPNGGGESDTPSHCDTCGVFLENALTSDGYDYVKEAITANDGDKNVLKEWSEYYDIDGDIAIRESK